jgi:formamidopyrimidine-DNA glycosylase
VPELPEVETVVRLVRPRLRGRTLTGASVGWARTLGGQDPAAFRRAILGARAAGVRRRGKYVLVDLERDGAAAGHLVCHLRMTGRLHVEPDGWDAGPYERVRLPLDDGTNLHFLDVRKFGRLQFALRLEDVLPELGPEPLSDEFTAAWLAGALRSRRRLLKPLLLDQAFLAGLGNIYVDEALFAARLHPLTASDRVSPRRAEELRDAIRVVLAEAIRREGSSFDAFYRTPEGRPGSYQHQFQVYGRAGLPCRRCGATVRRIVVGQRGTHLCRRCQRAPRRAAGSISRP